MPRLMPRVIPLATTGELSRRVALIGRQEGHFHGKRVFHHMDYFSAAAKSPARAMASPATPSTSRLAASLMAAFASLRARCL